MRAGAPAVLLGAAALLAGCGGGHTSEGAKPPAQILADATRAAGRASSVHAFGSFMNEGSPLRLNLRLARGKGGRGSLGVGGARVDVVRIGDRAYLRGSSAFYRRLAGARVASLLRRRWLEGRARSGALASVASLTDMAAFFRRALKPGGALKKGKEMTVDGRRAVPLASSAGGTLYVAATGTPYPLEVTEPAGATPGTVRFDDWNAPVALTAPQNALDLGKLGG